jgi:hypothetical protein
MPKCSKHIAHAYYGRILGHVNSSEDFPLTCSGRLEKSVFSVLAQVAKTVYPRAESRSHALQCDRESRLLFGFTSGGATKSVRNRSSNVIPFDTVIRAMTRCVPRGQRHGANLEFSRQISSRSLTQTGRPVLIPC